MTYGIVVSEFNEEVVKPLLAACLAGFKEQGIEPEVIWVPGAVEIPLACQRFIQEKKPKAVVALGCVVQGDTDHYKAVCEMCADGIMKVILETNTPIVFEVLMVDKVEKALARIEKGHEAATTAVRMGLRK